MDDHSDITIEKPEAPVQPKPSFWQRRMLVIALLFSFFSCLAAFSLVVDFFHLFNQMTPFRFWLFQFIANNRVALIVAPLIGLVLSAGALCYVTRNVMSGPVRYLDERQKMVRDQAHGSAYTIMKFVFMIGILGFVLFNTIMPAQNSQTQSASVFKQLNPNLSALSWYVNSAPTVRSDVGKQVLAASPNVIIDKGTKEVLAPQIVHPVSMFYFFSSTPTMTQWPASPTSSAFFYSTLLLCLFVMITTLPKAIAAWRQRL